MHFIPERWLGEPLDQALSLDHILAISGLSGVREVVFNHTGNALSQFLIARHQRQAVQQCSLVYIAFLRKCPCEFPVLNAVSAIFGKREVMDFHA